MLPLLVKWNFERMVAEGSLSEHELAFFTDKRLAKFWKKVGDYLAGVQPDYQQGTAERLAGSFLVPLAFGCGVTGTRDMPSRKTKIYDAQHKADPVIDRIARLSGELADALEELENITPTHPCQVRLLAIVRPLIRDEKIDELTSYWEGVRTSEALRVLQTKFSEYPKANELFKDVPGMASQKATWRDWMREAESNLADMLRANPGDLTLTESDWLNIVNVLIGRVSRPAMQDARRSCNAQPE